MVNDYQLLVGFIGGVYSLMFFLRGLEGILAGDKARIVVWMVGAVIVAVGGLVLMRVRTADDGADDEVEKR
ncbi:MAG TPA: hypothetical protein VGB18_07935 [Candidatus Thermoplasmatota archaeon]